MTKKLILIVDDDAISRHLIKSFLKNNDNYVVEAVENGADCLEFIKQNKVDLVITDVEMDDLTGLEISKILLSEKTTSEIPIILLSVRDQREITSESQNYSNVKKVVQKPYDFDFLLPDLKEIFNS